MRRLCSDWTAAILAARHCRLEARGPREGSLEGRGPGGTLAPIRDPVRLYTAQRFFHGLAYSLFATVFLPYQIQTVGLQPYQLILMGTVLEVTVFLFEVPTGVVADYVSRRLSVAVGLVTIGVSAILMALAPSLWPFLVAQIVWGIGETFISGAKDAWVADEIPHGPRPDMLPTKAFLVAEQGWMAGLVLGMWGSVVLGARSLSVPFLVGGAALIVVGIVSQLVLPERGFKKVRDEERTTWSALKKLAVEGFGIARKRVVFGLIILIVFIHGIASEGLDRLWAQHLIDLKMPPLGLLPQITWWAIIGTVYTALAVVITAYFRKKSSLLEAKSLFKLVSGMTLVLSFAVIAFGFAAGFWGALVAFLIARGIRRSLDPLITGWINHHAESNVRATMLSFQGQAHGVGEMVGGPMAALVARLSTVPIALAASAAMLWPSLFVIVKARKLPDGTPDDREEPTAA